MPTTVRPETRIESASPRPATSASRRPSRASSRFRHRDACDGSLLPAVDDELGSAPEELHELGRELAARGGLASTGSPGERSGEQRDGDPHDQQPRGEDHRGGRQERRGKPDRGGADDERDERRPEAADVKTLERVDVPDHASEQVTAAVALELGRRERLDPLVEAGADPAERAQGEVVRDETVEVPGQRAGEPEKADCDDRHRQRQDRRLLGGARDQVPRRRHQCDAEQDGKCAEHDRERCARPRHTSEPDDLPE